ncbi:MAG: methylmalonyl-CoA mutase family protein [Planctomycetota bacterium]|jgi:methylmalonyl-CoA mutase|nr:methylmalonyl-CoA mutase family protein [Planctomycetota bacterium]
MDSAPKLTSSTPPQIDLETWRAQVEKELQGADYERAVVRKSFEAGRIEPVYGAGNSPAPEPSQPAKPPFLRGSRDTASWSNAPRYDIPHAEEVRKAALKDLEGGSHGMWLQLDACARLGLAPDSPNGSEAWGDGGCIVWSLAGWRALMADIRLDMIDLALDAGANSLCNFAGLVALAGERGEDISKARWNLGLDPLGNLARDGFLPLGSRCMMHQIGTAVAWTKEHMPHTRPMLVSTEVYHMAGATLPQQLGIMAATMSHYLSLGERLDIPFEDLAAGMGLRLVPGRELFPGIASLRAARLIWARVLQACGFSEDEMPAPWIHGVNSRRTLARADAWTNQLRGTTQTLAAVLGGADMITTYAYDEALGQPSTLGRRVARNTQNILSEESRLDQVVDAGGGSYLIESLTESLASEAWAIFQGIQANGGMPNVLTTGWIHDRLAQDRINTEAAVRKRKLLISGVSSYPLVDAVVEEGEPYLTQRDEEGVREWIQTRDPENQCCALTVAGGFEEIIAACEDGADVFALTEALGDLSGNSCDGPKADPLPQMRDAAGFEGMQARAMELRVAGLKPIVFLATLGSTAEYAARLSYAQQFFRVGGFECIVGSSLEDLRESGAKILCVCGNDQAYAKMEVSYLEDYKKAGVKKMLLAGRPPDVPTDSTWQQAGLDGFIGLGCDALTILSDLQEVYG